MTQLFVNNIILGMTVYPDPYQSQKLLITSEVSPYRPLLGIQAEIFHCCGATEITHLDYTFTDEVIIQNFVHKLFGLIDERQSYYMIAASHQLSHIHSKDVRVMDVLISLGAKEVDVRPNRNHGPSNLHLFVWDPLYRKESGWDKYLKFYPKFGATNPLWFDKLSVEDQQILIDGSKDTALRMKQEEDARKERNRKAKLDDQKWAAQNLIRGGHMDEHLKNMGYVKSGEKPEVNQIPLKFNVPYGVTLK